MSCRLWWETVVGVVFEGLGARGGVGEWGFGEEGAEEGGGGGFEVGSGEKEGICVVVRGRGEVVLGGVG